MINEKVARKQELKIEMKLRRMKASDNKEEIKSDRKKEDEGRHPLSLLFDLSNVKEMVRCCIKPRPNKVRTQIWLIFVTMIILIMSFSG